MSLQAITADLVKDLSKLTFSPPVAHVYNPLEYASKNYAEYLDRFASDRPEVVLLGMNPGPWGMAQTGVPFGEVAAVRDWMKIDKPLSPPCVQHPRRPIMGLACHRSEVSGARLWGWARETFKTPKRFARRFFVANYCPLSFMEDTGRNRTPDKLPAEERTPLYEACDRALRRTVEHLKPAFVIGIGAFAETRARESLDGLDVTIGRVLHPSPASPLANKGWAERAASELASYGIKMPNTRA